MSQRITFRDLSRITFVKGEETTGTPADGFVACGPGTAYPMEATLAQIAEIYYRVKDAWFTGGTTTSDYGTMMSASGYAPSNRSRKIGTYTYQHRGYTKSGTDDYNGAAYDAGNGEMFSDIADSELGIWRDCWRTPAKNAFSYDADDFHNTIGSNSEWFGTGGGGGAKVQVIIGSNIGVILSVPENSLLDPANRFFLELEFWYVDHPSGFIPDFGGSTNRLTGAFEEMDYYETHFNYVMRLSPGDGSNDLSCPFYIGPAGATGWGGSDYIHAAKKWWPYATTTGAPAWDEDTGLPINGGPGA